MLLSKPASDAADSSEARVRPEVAGRELASGFLEANTISASGRPGRRFFGGLRHKGHGSEPGAHGHAAGAVIDGMFFSRLARRRRRHPGAAQTGNRSGDG